MEVQQGVGAEEVTFETESSATIDSVAASTTAQARVLTKEEYGQRDFQDTHAFTKQHMRDRVVEQFPQRFWDDVKHKRRVKSSSKSATTITESKEEL